MKTLAGATTQKVLSSWAQCIINTLSGPSINFPPRKLGEYKTKQKKKVVLVGKVTKKNEDSIELNIGENGKNDRRTVKMPQFQEVLCKIKKESTITIECTVQNGDYTAEKISLVSTKNLYIGL